MILFLGPVPHLFPQLSLSATWRCIDLRAGPTRSNRSIRCPSWCYRCQSLSTLVIDGPPSTAWIRPDLGQLSPAWIPASPRVRRPVADAEPYSEGVPAARSRKAERRGQLRRQACLRRSRSAALLYFAAVRGEASHPRSLRVRRGHAVTEQLMMGEAAPSSPPWHTGELGNL
jgi:hypothetical protein